MIINEKIIHDIQVLGFTLIISPVREIPNTIKITIRNDDYVYSTFADKDIYNIESAEFLEYVFNRFKEELRQVI